MNSPAGGRTTSGGGTSIAFERSGTGPALILVDPAGGFREVGPMRPLATHLASHFTVFAYDRRGRGESTDTLPYSVEREIDDLASLIEAAGGSAFVYGFSSGAILALVVLGRREEALEHWMKRIGVPTEIITAMRGDPSWPARAAVAHTLVYESLFPGTLEADQLSAIVTPTRVVASDASGDPMQSWARGLAEALPNGSLRILKGMWHGVPPEVLAPVLTEFFIGH